MHICLFLFKLKCHCSPEQWALRLACFAIYLFDLLVIIKIELKKRQDMKSSPLNLLLCNGAYHNNFFQATQNNLQNMIVLFEKEFPKPDQRVKSWSSMKEVTAACRNSEKTADW